MNISEDSILPQLMRAKSAKKSFFDLDSDKVNLILDSLADNLEENYEKILVQNQRDLELLNPNLSIYDRVKLTKDRISEIANSLRKLVELPDPTQKVLEDKKLANGLSIKKVTTSIGVIGVIYEARPNVTIDVFALCLKSGNVAVLKGGSDANFSNQILIDIIQDTLRSHNLQPEIVTLLPSSRQSVDQLLKADDLVDVIIPRGSYNLIQFVRSNSRIPVIETGAGVCHIYWDKSGNPSYAKEIIVNAKTRRPSVCNSLDCLLINESNLARLLPVAKELFKRKVELLVDEKPYLLLKDIAPEGLLFRADETHYGTEFLGLKMAVKTVKDLDEALIHIANYSSGHSEGIITEDQDRTKKFVSQVDSAAVYKNTSIAFTDGFEFGLGAEIGISTQKLHARGPMGLEALTSYKWVISSQGLIR